MDEISTHQIQPRKVSAFDASRKLAYLEQEKGKAQGIVEQYEQDPNSVDERRYNYSKDRVNNIKQREQKLFESTPAINDIDSIGDAVDFVAGIGGGMVGTYGSYAKNAGDVWSNKENAFIADLPEGERTQDAKDHAELMSGVSLAADVPIFGGVLGSLTKGVGKSVVKGIVKDVVEDVATNSIQAAAEQSGRGQDVDVGDVMMAGAVGATGGQMARIPAKVTGSAFNKVMTLAKDPSTPTGKVVDGVNRIVNNVYGRRLQNQEQVFIREGNAEGLRLHKDLREEMDILRTTELARGETLLQDVKKNFKRKDHQMFSDFLTGKRTDFEKLTPEQADNLVKMRQLLDGEHNRGVEEGHGTWTDVPVLKADGTPKLNRNGQPATKKGRVLRKVENYVPITPDAEILKARRTEAIESLVAEGKYSKDAATSVIDGYVAASAKDYVPSSRYAIAQLESGIMPRETKGKPKGNSNLDQSRLIDASQEWQTEFSSGNMIDGLSDWNKRRAHSVALDTYVGIDGAKLAKRLSDVDKVGESGLTTDYVKDVAQAVDLYDRGVGASLSPGNRKALNYAKSVANFAYLPLTALSSLTETFNLATKVGAIPWAMAQTKMVASVGQNMLGTAFKTVPKPELHKQLQLAGRAWDTSTDQLASRLGEGGTKGMEYFNDKFFKVTLQSPINYINNVAAVHAMQAQIKNDIVIMGKNTGTERYKLARERLENLGIDVDDADILSGFKTRSGVAYEEAMPAVINRFTRDIVLNPTAFDKPAWSSTGWMSMFAQLQGYPMMWASQVFPRMIANASGTGKSSTQALKDKANLAMTLSAMTLVSYLQESMKAEIRGQDKTEDELVMLAWTRAAAPYQVGNLMNAVMGKHEGFQGMLFGAPAVSIFDDIMTNLRAAIDGDLSPENMVFLKQFNILW